MILREIVRAADISIPEKEGQGLQQAVDACAAAEGTPGTPVYVGLHMQLSVGFDLAVDVFWTIGSPTNHGFIRVMFGAELGFGADLSFLLGFAFTERNCKDQPFLPMLILGSLPMPGQQW